MVQSDLLSLSERWLYPLAGSDWRCGPALRRTSLRHEDPFQRPRPGVAQHMRWRTLAR